MFAPATETSNPPHGAPDNLIGCVAVPDGNDGGERGRDLVDQPVRSEYN